MLGEENGSVNCGLLRVLLAWVFHTREKPKSEAFIQPVSGGIVNMRFDCKEVTDESLFIQPGEWWHRHEFLIARK